jgi:uncharacterized protein (UPF0332 family)
MINQEKLLTDKAYCEEIFKSFLKKKAIKEDKLKAFKKHLDKSMNNLEFANYILEEHNHSVKEKLPNKKFYDWCITIYYYSLYHSALALVSKAGFESKNHLATITALTLFYYHKNNILNKEEIEFLLNSFAIEKEDINFILDTKDLRERASYGVESFEQKQAEDLRVEVADFVNKCKEILEE